MARDFEQEKIRKDVATQLAQQLQEMGRSFRLMQASVTGLLGLRAEIAANDAAFDADDLAKVDLRLAEVRADIDTWYNNLPGA